MIKKKKNSLLVRILAFQIIIGIVPLLLLGIVSIFSMSSVLKTEAIDFQKESVKQGSLYIDLVMNSVESLIANLSGIEEVNNVLGDNITETSYEKLTTQAKIGYILSGYTNLKGLISIDLFSQSGAHYHVGETLSATNINEEVLDSLFDETLNSEGFVNWSGIEDNINMDSEYSSVITASKILYGKRNQNDLNDSIGILVVSYDPDVFAGQFGDTSDKASYTMVLDSKNRVVYHPNNQYIGHVMSDDLASQLNLTKTGSFTEKIQDEDMLVIFDGTQKGGWTVAKFIPLSNILSKSSSMTVMFVILIILSAAVTGVFGLIMSRQIIQPIKKVTDTFRLLKSGDFKNVSKLKLVHHDEIGELGNLFNSFIDANEDITIQKKLERQLNEQNQELHDALQTLKAAQTQMVQQEKMAGIGQLAAGVAHEINNPLGFVTSNFSVLNKYIMRLEKLLETIEKFRTMEEQPDEDIYQAFDQAWKDNSIEATRSDLKEIISDTREGLSRIAEIVNALKTFSRSSLLEEHTPYDINEGIRTTLLIANNEIKYNSTVQFDPSVIPEINANGGQINQVLLNIIINAAQAIKQKNQIDKGFILIKTYVETEYICCEISDNGCGMNEDVLNRIFEPFFTTKPVGQGTGLGLSLAYDIIVNKHGGKLNVTSLKDMGTSFKILIPIMQKRLKEEPY